MNALKLKNLPLIVLLFIVTGFSSCSTDVDDKPSLLGNWIEEAPIEGRTQLYFHAGNRISRTDVDGNIEMYSYRIDGDSLILWLEGESEESGSATLYFRQIDRDTFQIENLYASFPEMETTFMIFIRS